LRFRPARGAGALDADEFSTEISSGHLRTTPMCGAKRHTKNLNLINRLQKSSIALYRDRDAFNVF
jgi:hypothetical protein